MWTIKEQWRVAWFIDTDPEAHYYTLKAFCSQRVSFRTKRSNRIVQSVGSLREFSLSLSKWRIENEDQSSLIYFENYFFISYIRTFLWNCFDLQDNFEYLTMFTRQSIGCSASRWNVKPVHHACTCSFE